MVWTGRGHHSARSDLHQRSDKFFSSGGVPFFPELQQSNSLTSWSITAIETLMPFICRLCQSKRYPLELSEPSKSTNTASRTKFRWMYSEHIAAVSDKTLQRVKPNVKPHPIFDHYLNDDMRNNRNLSISWFQEERETHVRGFGLRMNHKIRQKNQSCCYIDPNFSNCVV